MLVSFGQTACRAIGVFFACATGVSHASEQREFRSQSRMSIEGFHLDIFRVKGKPCRALWDLGRPEALDVRPDVFDQASRLR